MTNVLLRRPFPRLILATDFFQGGDARFIGLCLPKGKVIPLLGQACLFIDHRNISIHKSIVTRETRVVLYTLLKQIPSLGCDPFAQLPELAVQKGMFRSISWRFFDTPKITRRQFIETFTRVIMPYKGKELL